MTDDPDKYSLATFKRARLTSEIKRHLTDQLELRFREYPGDATVAHSIIAPADEVPVMLLCDRLAADKYEIYLHNAGTDPRDDLIMEYQSKVDLALADLPSA